MDFQSRSPGSRSDTVPLKVLAHGLSRSEFSALEVLVPRRLRREVAFSESLEEQPDLILFGSDGSDGLRRWKDLRQRYPATPAVCLTYGGEPLEGALVVPRPARVDVLIESIERALAGHISFRHTGEQRAPGTAHQEQSSIEQFDLKERLIGVLLRADRLATETGRDVLVDGMGRFLFLRQGQVFTTVGWGSLRSLCVPRITTESFNVRVVDSRRVEAVMNVEGTSALWGREAFLWEMAWNCSRGALPLEIAPDAPLVLQRWPDCTRLREPLVAVALSALFATRPISVLDAAQEMGLSTTQVACYVTAAYGLSLIGIEHRVPRAVRTAGSREDKKRGWSSRVLGRLARRVASRVLGKNA